MEKTLKEIIATFLSERHHLGIESASVDAEDLVNLIERLGWQSPEEVRQGKQQVREAFRFPKGK